jgi:hypothetical protein
MHSLSITEVTRDACLSIGMSDDISALIIDYWSHARRVQSATISCYDCD